MEDKRQEHRKTKDETDSNGPMALTTAKEGTARAQRPQRGSAGSVSQQKARGGGSVTRVTEARSDRSAAMAAMFAVRPQTCIKQPSCAGSVVQHS